MTALAGFLTAEAISIIGSRMSLVAIPWLVLTTTGSPTLTGVVVAAETVPYVLAGSIGASVIDRVGARRCSIAADGLSLVAMGLIPLLYQTGIGMLLILVVIAGTARGFSDLAKRVLLPGAARQSGVELPRATALYDGIARLGALIGGPLAGFLIAWLNAPVVILIDAFSFAACALLIAVTLPAVRPDPASAEEREPYLAALVAGVRYIRQDKLILSIIGLMCAINLLDNAALSVYIPVWARDVVGSPIALGLCTGAFALGAVIGNLALIGFAKRFANLTLLAAGFLVGGAPRFLALGLSNSVVLVAAVMFVAGLGLSVVNPIITAVLYERVPEQLHARVFGAATGAAFAGMPMGSLLAGVGITLIGFTPLLVLTAALALAATLTPVLARRTWRQVDARET